jgi:hypothetical protein
MKVIYVVHSVQVVKKKNGLRPKSSVSEAFNDPSRAHKTACKSIEKIIKREGYFTEKPAGLAGRNEPAPSADTVARPARPANPAASEYEKRMLHVKEIMESEQTWPARYYDMDDLLSLWCPTVAELNCKKYDVRVSECDLS